MRTVQIARWLGFLLGAVTALIIGSLGYLRTQDGPYGPLPGGSFTSGQTVTSLEEWQSILQMPGDAELELVSEGTSRSLGVIVLNGEAYIPCDLGFIWRRVPDTQTRLILHTIWLFKDWHERALQDDRGRVRTQGKIFPSHLTLVDEPTEQAALRTHIEALAREFMTGLLDEPLDPNAIWFFKLSPDLGANPDQ